MKNCIAFLLMCLLVMVVGCGSFQINESSTHKAISYTSGRAMGILITEKIPEANDHLSVAWTNMMNKVEGLETISSSDVMLFYNESFKIISGYKDKYGLMGDLRAMLTIYGAQLDENGSMYMVKPVPKSVMVFFGEGYATSREFVEGSKE